MKNKERLIEKMNYDTDFMAYLFSYDFLVSKLGISLNGNNTTMSQNEMKKWLESESNESSKE